MMYLSTLSALAQSTNENPVVEEQTLSIMDLLLSGGTGAIVIIAILFVLLFVAVYIYFERLFAIKAASKYDEMEKLKQPKYYVRKPIIRLQG